MCIYIRCQTRKLTRPNGAAAVADARENLLVRNARIYVSLSI